MKIKTTITKYVTEEKEVEVKHRHTLSNYAIWKWGNGIMSYLGDNEMVLTSKGFKKNKEILGWIMFITCKICKKQFASDYNHLRWETSKKTGEYLPA